MSHKPGHIGKNDENGLYSQIVFNVSTIMKDTQTQMRWQKVSEVMTLHVDDVPPQMCSKLSFLCTDRCLQLTPELKILRG